MNKMSITTKEDSVWEDGFERGLEKGKEETARSIFSDIVDEVGEISMCKYNVDKLLKKYGINKLKQKEISNEISICNSCHCITKSIPTKVDNIFICGKCGFNKYTEINK